jgi:hypothetical protein
MLRQIIRLTWLSILFKSLIIGNFLGATALAAPTAERLKVGVFAVDASPPIGSPLAYDETKGVAFPLSCRGIVLVGEGKPIVLCAIDWIGIANDGQVEFRHALAEAAGTDPKRVAVHALHQHDAPICDFSTDRLLAKYGINRAFFDAPFARDVIARTSAELRVALASARPVTHLGLGQSEIEMVASNRRILGPDGKVEHVRWTACKEPEVRAMPVGTIDPVLRMISFWDGDEPIAALTYYATHPQSYYRTGLANPDFPGMARDQRQAATKVPHIHFDGAGGNVGAGKWNDGSHENRQILADRVAAGMQKAFEATVKVPIAAADLAWESLPVALPPAPHLNEERLEATLTNASKPARERAEAAHELVWLRRCHSGGTIDVSCLHLGSARILHLPGELFVEYQLAAQKLRPDLFIAMAAYGDYAPGYIGTEIAYPQGGYETGPKASLVAPTVERTLMDVINRLLRK